MANSDNNQSQNNQSNQQTNSPQQPVEQSSIPATPDQSLASNMNKELDTDNSIPNQSDQSLSSSKTMNEDGLETVK